MTIIDRARKLRGVIEKMAATLDDSSALENVELFSKWKENTAYTIGQRVRYGETLYKALQNHTSQKEWTPDISVSLWTKVLIPDPDVIPEWEQPESTNPYMIGDKVTHNGKTWESTMDNNVFEPGVAGWIEVTI